MPPIFTHRTNVAPAPKRFAFLVVLIFAGIIIIIARLFVLQILRHEFYSALAAGQHEITKTLLPERGEIFLRSSRDNEQLYPLATNVEFFSVYAEPFKVKQPQKITELLSPILDIATTTLLAKLEKENDPYELLKKQITAETKEKIQQLRLDGIGFSAELGRFYPEKDLGSHLLGFVGFSEKGQAGHYGLEGYFNAELSGKPGVIHAKKDAKGRQILIGQSKIEPAENGADLILTIDRAIQYFACEQLRLGIKKYEAAGGTVILMNPWTGAILAMCSEPAYDPNEYSKASDVRIFNNPALYNAYEPGSVMKPITMAAGIDLGKIGPNTTFVDEGAVQIGKDIIKNADDKVYGRQTMTDVLKYSINTGAVFAAKQIGGAALKKYFENFGFGTLTGIELETETGGDIKMVDRGDIYTATAAFGQGMSVTPLQMLSAYASLANGGKLVKPYIVDEIIKNDGIKIKTQPKIIKEVVSQRAAVLVAGMLAATVEDGQSRSAKVGGYVLAGKTGTAQVPLQGRAGYSERVIHTFVGFGPVDNPQFVGIVKLDYPVAGRWAALTTAPMFGQIAKFLLSYYQIPPK